VRGISRRNIIFFIEFWIVGMFFLIAGFDYYSRSIRYDSFWEMAYAMFFITPGAIIIILTIIGGIYVYLKSPPGLDVKKDYTNLKWLNHQYYELGRSLQDIASDQGVSMITVKKWVDKLDGTLGKVGAKE